MKVLFLSFFLFVNLACSQTKQDVKKVPQIQIEYKLATAAFELTKDKVVYDPSYFSIDYPNGDIPKGKGVCTDVIIRAYRKLNIDLQKDMYLDIKQNFTLCPKIWVYKKQIKISIIEECLT